MTGADLQWIIPMLSLAGFMQGLTGFGFGLVAMALLPAVIDLQTAASLTAVFIIPVAVVTFLANRQHHDWRQGRSLMLGVCCGLPIGVYLLVAAAPQLLLRLLGLLMVGIAINEALGTRERRLAMPQAWGFPVGVCSGIFAGAFNTGGPPLVAYAYSQPWSKEQTVAVLQLVFLVSATLRLLLYSTGGLFHADLLAATLWSALPVLVGIFLGKQLFTRLPQHRLRSGVFLFLGVMGLHYLLR